MVIRDAREADIAAIARFFRAIVAAGETYAYPEDLDDDGVADLWSEAPPGRTVVARSGSRRCAGLASRASTACSSTRSSRPTSLPFGYGKRWDSRS